MLAQTNTFIDFHEMYRIHMYVTSVGHLLSPRVPYTPVTVTVACKHYLCENRRAKNLMREQVQKEKKSLAS